MLLTPRRHPPAIHIIHLRLARRIAIEAMNVSAAQGGVLNSGGTPGPRGWIDMPDVFEGGDAFGAQAVLRETAIGGEAVDVEVAIVFSANGVAHFSKSLKTAMRRRGV